MNSKAYIARLLFIAWLFMNSIAPGVAADDAQKITPATPAATNAAAVELAQLAARIAQTNLLRTSFLTAVQAGDTGVVTRLLVTNRWLAGAREIMPLPLMAAVSQSNAALAEILLEAGVDVNILDQRQQSALTFALSSTIQFSRRWAPTGKAMEPHLPMVKLLLAHGASIYSPIEFRGPLIHALAASRRGDLVDFLLTNCLPAVATNASGDSLVHLAVQWDRTNALAALAAKRVDCNVTNSAGLTPLQVLARLRPVSEEFQHWRDRGPALGDNAWSHRDLLIQLLLAGGAKMDIFSVTALDRSGEMDAFLKTNVQLVFARDVQGATPLHWAAELGATNAITPLLAAGLSIEQTNFAGLVPLDVAAHYSQHVTALLLARGASVIRRPGAKTPLHSAVENGYGPYVALLLDAGSDLHATNEFGEPLDLAARGNHAAAAKELIRRGASAIRPPGAKTPLHWAIEHGSREMTEALLLADADGNAANESGETPLDLAARHNREKLLDLLWSSHARFRRASGETSPLHWAVRHGNTNLVRFWLDQGLNVNLPDEAGRTPLLLSYSENKPFDPRASFFLPPGSVPVWTPTFPIAQMLIARGANINAADTNGNTVLHLSVLTASDDLPLSVPPPARIKILSNENQAFPKDGKLPSHTAAPAAPTRSMMQFLLEHGAAVNATNRLGETPLHRAAAKTFGGTNAVTDARRWLAPILSANARLEARDLAGRTALHRAVAVGNFPVMTALLAHGARVNATDTNGLSPLHLITAAMAKDFLPLLLEHGADINAGDRDGNTLLHHAVAKADLPFVEELLRQHARINARNRAGETPFLFCLSEKCPVDPDLIALLGKRGADLHASDAQGRTALHRMVQIGRRPASEEAYDKWLVHHPEYRPYSRDQFLLGVGTLDMDPRLLNFFIEMRAGVTTPDRRGRTPLHVAATIPGKESLAERLIKAGADVNAKDQDGNTPLHLAAAKAHPPMLQMLTAHQAGFLLRNRQGDTPVSIAQRVTTNAYVYPYFSPSVPEVADMVRAGDLARLQNVLAIYSDYANWRHPDGFSPLQVACAAGRVEMVNLLVKHGSRLNETYVARKNLPLFPWIPAPQPGAYQTPLQLALTGGHREIAESLVKHGAECDLHSAVQLGMTARVQTILKTAPDRLNEYATRSFVPGVTNSAPLLEGTPLHFAVRTGQQKMVKWLIDHGADVLAFDHAGRTPYYFAVTEKRDQIAQLLLRHGADGDVFAAASLGQTGHLEKILIAKPALLNATNVQCRTLLHVAIFDNQPTVAELLLRRGADVNARLAPSDNSPLQLAVANGNDELFRLLLAFHADIKATNWSGRTPFHQAFLSFRTNMTERLLAAGAEVNAVDRYGYTPLHHAACAGNVTMVEFLLQHGANVNAQVMVERDLKSMHYRNISGNTPLHCALSLGHTNIVALLIAKGARMNVENMYELTPLGMVRTPYPADGPHFSDGFTTIGLARMGAEKREELARWLILLGAEEPKPPSALCKGAYFEKMQGHMPMFYYPLQ